MWILNTKVNSFERVKRSFAFRYEGLDQQRKLAQSTKGSINPQTIIQRIDKVEQIALRLGFDKIVDRKGKRVGVGQAMPAITEIVINMLDKEQDYRLLSGMVHAHPWALQNFGFIKAQGDQTIFENVKGAYFEKHLSFDLIFFLCTNCVTSLFQALLMNFNLFGWDAKPLATVVGDTIKKIKPPYP